mmetsp:Transcript_13016/g.48712  ORF Transcript_13016/g.48712 Transcript_13016/m.48712 type:complete len:219 (+) Transcript_13016:1556-2212(+)
MRNSSSHGTRVPNPKLREHAHCRSHPRVPSNARRDSSWYVFMFAKHFLLFSSHVASPYSRYHWSVRATTHSSPDRDITAFSGSLYTMASPLASIASLINGLTSFTARPLNSPKSITPSVNPFRYVRCLASSSLTLSFCDLIFSCSHTTGAHASPNSGMCTQATTSKGMIHSSFTPNFSRIGGLAFKSDMAMKSAGESDGTEVTTPVPLFIKIVSMGRQ